MRRAANAPIQLSAAALKTFEQSDLITQTFFRSGSEPRVSFEMIPVDMDATLGRFVLNLEGKEISWEHGPVEPSFMQWPGPSPGEVRLEVRTLQSGRSPMKRERGPWAWFRVLDEAQIKPTSRNEIFEVEFDLEGHKVVYELIASSAYNPFRFHELEQFSCPNKL